MKKVLTIVAVVMISIMMISCNSGEKGKKQESTNTNNQNETTKKDDNSTITIGFSSKDNSDTFVKAIADAAEARAKELGIKLIMNDAGGDVNQQINDVETLIAQKVDAIIAIPQSVEGSAPIVGMCKEAGIPLIIDNGDIADKDYTAFVGCTDQESGEILGKWFMENVPKGSKVCIIEGPMGQSGQVGRYAGFKAVGMLDHFEVLSCQTGNWKREEALALTEDWLVTYGDELKAIICENDDMALGALSACKAAGRTDIVIGGVDGLDDAVEAVKNKEMGISVLQDSNGQGTVGIDVAVQAAKGEKVKYDTRIPFVAITTENVDAYLEGGVKAITK